MSSKLYAQTGVYLVIFKEDAKKREVDKLREKLKTKDIALANLHKQLYWSRRKSEMVYTSYHVKVAGYHAAITYVKISCAHVVMSHLLAVLKQFTSSQK